MRKQFPFINVKDKVLDVYSQFDFAETWNFINPDKNVYELRLLSPKKNDPVSKYITKLGNILKCYRHRTGIFIADAASFKMACVFAVKHRISLHLSVNPKRKSHHEKELNLKKRFNGKKQSELGIFNVLIDFDATTKLKNHPSLISEEVCYRKAKKFLDANKNIHRYMITCSGYGVHLRIPLDSPILFPADEYDSYQRFVETEETKTFHRILKKAMEKITEKYSDANVKIDDASFEVARTSRSPFSLNFKKDSVRYSGVIEIVDEGPNAGLHDYVMSFFQKELTIQKNAIKKLYSGISEEFSYDETNVRDSGVARLLLDPTIPKGGRNNILFFQFKLLCKNNNISLESQKDFIREIERIQQDTFPLNEPEIGNFNPNAVINYLISGNYKPIYPVLYWMKKIRTVPDEYFQNYQLLSIKTNPLPSAKNLIQRILMHLNENPPNYNNPSLLQRDVNVLLSKIQQEFGDKKLNYLINNNIIKTIFEKYIERVTKK